MPENLEDRILCALKQYEGIPAKLEKKAVLLTPNGGYFLYGNRFCSISGYELEMSAGPVQMQVARVTRSLFFSVCQSALTVAGVEQPEYVSLIFHMDLGEDGLLRGILFCAGQDADLVLFTDEKVEKIYRTSCRLNQAKRVRLPPEGELCKAAENIRQNDLRWLTALYLNGRKLSGSELLKREGGELPHDFSDRV